MLSVILILDFKLHVIDICADVRRLFLARDSKRLRAFRVTTKSTLAV